MKQSSARVDLTALKQVIQQAKSIAKHYREITGKPLGITGEIGEFAAAELLGLELAEASALFTPNAVD